MCSPFLRLSAEQVGVGPGTGGGQDQNIPADQIDQQPVGLDVTFPKACIVAGEGMAPLFGQLVVLTKLSGSFQCQHSRSSSSSSSRAEP